MGRTSEGNPGEDATYFAPWSRCAGMYTLNMLFITALILIIMFMCCVL